MSVLQYRRRFKAEPIEKGALTTHKVELVIKEIDKLRAKVNQKSILQASTWKRFKAGRATLLDLKMANWAKANAVKDLEAFAPIPPIASQSDRKSLYQ